VEGLALLLQRAALVAPPDLVAAEVDALVYVLAVLVDFAQTLHRGVVGTQMAARSLL
jgi:hypothetical protein